MTPDPVKPSRVGQIAVTAYDLERAITFYRDVLGLRYLFQIPGAAFFEVGGLRLLIGIPEGEFDHPASTLYYQVENIREAFGKLSASDVTVIQEPHLIAKMPDHELWMGFFRDSEGNILALMEEVR